MNGGGGGGKSVGKITEERKLKLGGDVVSRLGTDAKRKDYDLGTGVMEMF